jgi:hypothetical protein
MLCSPGWYLPERYPPASGDHTTMPTPFRAQVGTNSVPDHEAVLRLVRNEPGKAFTVAEPKGFHQPPGLVVAASRVTYLALAYEIVESPQHLFERRLNIDVPRQISETFRPLPPRRRYSMIDPRIVRAEA